MQMIHDEVYGIYPHCYVQLRPAISHFPTIFNVTGDAVVGNGSGYSQLACTGALGEYIERFHFYNEVERDVTAVLRQYNPAHVEKKLLHLINQIKISSEAAENHAFDLSAVKNIFNAGTFYIPSVIISLAQGDADDRKFIPFVDSCGQAAHGTQAQAYAAALKEFIERQALVGAWLSGRARHAIAITEHPDLGAANKIVRVLSGHGELLGYDLNTHLPGYSYVIFYFSRDKKDNVQYSVGMATDFDPAGAMRRAYNELWQSYSYVYLNADNPEDLDRRYQYLNDLLMFNHTDTRKLIPFVSQLSNELSTTEYINLKTFTEAECVQRLFSLSHDIYRYERQTNLFGSTFHFCKIFSPDFFLHMGIKMPLNLRNAYAESLSIPADIEIKNVIPFP